MSEPHTQDPVRYKTQCAVSDLLSFSGGIGLLLKGIEARLTEDEVEGALSDEQRERLADLFTTLHDAADNLADFAREIGEQVRR